MSETITMNIGDKVYNTQGRETVEIVGPGVGGWPEVKREDGYTYYLNPLAMELSNE